MPGMGRKQTQAADVRNGSKADDSRMSVSGETQR